MSVVQTQIVFLTNKNLKMSSVVPFTFNRVELCVVAINEKPWTRAKEVCRALEYKNKTAIIVKNHCSKENYAHKWQLSSVACTPINWPKWDSHKLDLYINEEELGDLLVVSQQPLAKELAEYMGIKIIGHNCVRKRLLKTS